MPYIKERCVIGDVIEIEKYYSWRYGVKGIPRNENIKSTTEVQRKINERMARKKKRRIINANFTVGDIYLTFTYKKENRPANIEDAFRNIKRFIDTLRRILKKQGEQLKYVGVTEIGQKGAVHHHLLIKKFDTNILFTKRKNNKTQKEKSIWVFGKVMITPIYTKDLTDLANYFNKESRGNVANNGSRKKWTQSRNLIIPQSEKRIIKAKYWTEYPKAEKGYTIIEDSIYSGICDWNGYPYQSYRMVKKE